ncbi:4452_t:CDS:2 [Funneliformis caledonium]|uniref:4452_t:CDS:1 n=1 Tax=Funneliformis caledonium TaxID=1117310 RepID=A0A9N9AD29_9GLOM|nr:4452_t:CDS:2 [Funneliformis caledonium]
MPSISKYIRNLKNKSFDVETAFAIYVWVGCNDLDSGNGLDAFDSSLSYSLIIDLSTVNASLVNNLILMLFQLLYLLSAT